MNLPPACSSSHRPLFERLRFILVETSRPGNIGAAARAMKTMGFSELVLVNPRIADALVHEEAIAFASGAQDILAGARIAGSIEEALEGCNFAAALSARLREFSPPVVSPRALATQLAGNAEVTAALVFGNERFGLPNEAVAKCNVLFFFLVFLVFSLLFFVLVVLVLAFVCRLA